MSMHGNRTGLAILGGILLAASCGPVTALTPVPATQYRAVGESVSKPTGYAIQGHSLPTVILPVVRDAFIVTQLPTPPAYDDGILLPNDEWTYVPLIHPIGTPVLIVPPVPMPVAEYPVPIPIPSCGPGEEAWPNGPGYECGPADPAVPEGLTP